MDDGIELEDFWLDTLALLADAIVWFVVAMGWP